jgi:hypothetical protein
VITGRESNNVKRESRPKSEATASTEATVSVNLDDRFDWRDVTNA